MAHGNRVHEAPKAVYMEWSDKSDSHSKITGWIQDCIQHEKDIANKNKIACDEFHKSLRR